MDNSQKSDSSEYLEILEKTKEQYQQYLEVSKLYDVTKLVAPKEEAVEYATTTTNTFGSIDPNSIPKIALAKK